MSHYYDRQGHPIDMFEWARLIEAESRHVAQTFIDDIRVSTIWLGLDHNWGFGGPPLIFETMIFGMGAAHEDLDLEEYQWRWSTEVQALAGHDQAVALVREALVRRGC